MLADPLLPRLLPPALTVLAQSTVILALGLLAVHSLRQRGPAAQSLLCRATLAALGVGLLLSVLLAGRITAAWRVSLPQAAPPPPIMGEPDCGRCRRWWRRCRRGRWGRC